MADENNGSDTPKQSKFSKMKPNLPKVDMTRVKDKGRKFAEGLRKSAIALSILAALVLGFLIGARMFELGYTESLGKGLKGATVRISGPCSVAGELREPALNEDEVKVTAIKGDSLLGVVRLTREVVECRLAEVAIDKLPLLSNLTTSPSKIPDLTVARVTRRETPSYKLLENKVILASGTCRSQTGDQLPSFTDERIDVTSVEASQDVADTFIISGIRRSDKAAIACTSRAIKYSVVDPNESPEPTPVPVTSYVNKIVIVNSRCLPDPRIQPPPRGEDGRKIAFFRLVNSEVQILEETLESGKLVKFTGTIVDRKVAGAFGQNVVCDASTYPLTYKEYDGDEISLNRADSQSNNKDAVTGSGAELEEAAPTPKATPSRGVVEPPTRMRMPMPPEAVDEK